MKFSKATLDKVIHENDYIESRQKRMGVAMCHALYAKNSLLDFHGYSPFMRVYGRQGRTILGIEHDKVVIRDEWVKKQFEGIQKDRKAYLQAESDEKIRTVLKRKADPYQSHIPLGTDVMYYRDDQKCEKGWNGPGKVKDRNGSDYTIKHGKQLISAQARDVRKFLTRKRFKEIDENETDEKITKPMMINDKTNDDYQFLISRKQEIKDGVECQSCKRYSTCMRTLTRNMDGKRTNKSGDSIEQIAKSIFVRNFLCSDCISAYRRQIIIESLAVGDISDTKVCDLNKVMDRMPTKKANFEFKVKTSVKTLQRPSLSTHSSMDLIWTSREPVQLDHQPWSAQRDLLYIKAYRKRLRRKQNCLQWKTMKRMKTVPAQQSPSSVTPQICQSLMMSTSCWQNSEKEDT